MARFNQIGGSQIYQPDLETGKACGPISNLQITIN